MTLSTDYATRIRRVADTVANLDVMRRDPERYHERKDEAVNDLRKLADAVEIDQVFADRSGLKLADQPAFRPGPRTIKDARGRHVAVEIRRRAGRRS